MTRTIKVSEVRPGMEVQWTSLGITRRCTGEVVDAGSPRDGVNLRTSEGGAVHIPGDAEVTVLTEPQPEEPTAFGARVVAGGYEFLLSHGGRRSWKARLDGKRYAWTDLCDMGSVVVIDAIPSWTVPEQATETPEVPEHIEEWDTWEDVPEGVAVTNPGLRYRYRKAGGKTEALAPDVLAPVGDAEWFRAYVSMESQPGPWTRVTDA